MTSFLLRVLFLEFEGFRDVSGGEVEVDSRLFCYFMVSRLRYIYIYIFVYVLYGFARSCSLFPPAHRTCVRAFKNEGRHR